MKKITAVFAAFAFAAAAFAAPAKKAAKKAEEPVTKIEITVVEDANFTQGKESPEFTQFLGQFTGLTPEVTKITEAQARADEKIGQLDLSALPLYLVKNTKEAAAKFADPIKQGFLKSTDDYIVLPRQTQEYVISDRAAKPNVLELFVMSQCPYGVMAESKLIEAQKAGKLPKDKEIQIRYIVTYDASTDTFSSLHGQPEWEEDARQLVIAKYFPNKFWKYLENRNEMYQCNKPLCLKFIMKESGLSYKKVEKLMDEGKELLKIEAQNAQGISASPTFLWQGRVKTDMNNVAKISGFEFFNPNVANGSAPAAPAGSC